MLSLFAGQCVSMLVADAGTPVGQEVRGGGPPAGRGAATADGALVGRA
jgi:hypothetical protein